MVVLSLFKTGLKVCVSYMWETSLQRIVYIDQYSVLRYSFPELFQILNLEFIIGTISCEKKLPVHIHLFLKLHIKL